MVASLCSKASLVQLRCSHAPRRAWVQSKASCASQSSIQADRQSGWVATASVGSLDVHNRSSSAQCRASALEVVSAQALGWIVIVGSWLRSVPQIIRIGKTKSVEGISVTAMVVETLCYTVIIGYNVNHYYAISTYGDVFACWLQNLIICGLLAWYKRPTKLQMSVGAVAFTVFNWWIISGYCGMRVLIAMQVFVGVAMSVGARIPQIRLNMQRGNTGELAMISFALSTAGNLIRCYTTIILTSDLLLLFTTATQALLNGIITVQCFKTEVARRKLAAEAAAA